MSRLSYCFAELASQSKKALIPFITTGDPADCPVADLMHALVDGGASAIELGLPFSDPAADGPVIQKASERALERGVTYLDSFAALKKFRQTNDHTPVILMGYLNPAETYQASDSALASGFTGFCQAAKTAGADALILVDLSYESGAGYRQAVATSQLDLIQLLAPTTSEARLGKIATSASGFIYYVSVRGVTGSQNQDGAARQIDTTELQQSIQAIRQHTKTPICVGFGIKDAASVKQIAPYADGVIVGTALVDKLYQCGQQNPNNPNAVLQCAGEFMQTLRQALDDGN